MKTAGLFDLQVNGYAGVDFNDPGIGPADLDRALEAMQASGVTGCLPTLITARREEMAERLVALDAAVSGSRLGRVMVPGYHLEGPFLNDAPGYRGCHPAEAMSDPDPAFITRIGAGLFRPVLLVTLAPERAGGAEAVRQLAGAGRIVAIGHSAAGYEEVAAAANAGATLSTHLGNGLPQKLPKLMNPLLAQLAEPRLTTCLIADGHHIPPPALAALIRLKGAGNCVLVTDAVLAAAAPPGLYRFAGMEICLGEDGRVTQPGHDGLAGAALCLDQAVRNLVDWRIAGPAEAACMAGDAARTVMRRAFAQAGIAPDSGEIRWNSALEPRIVRLGGMAS